MGTANAIPRKERLDMAYVRRSKKNNVRGVTKQSADTRQAAIAIESLGGRRYGKDEDNKVCPSREPTLKESETAEAMAEKLGINLIDEDISFDEVMQATCDGPGLDYKAIVARTTPEAHARATKYIDDMLAKRKKVRDNCDS